MAKVDFTYKKFNKICESNKKNYKKQETALLDHWHDEIKKCTGEIKNPLFIIYAFNWFRKIIKLMQENRKNKTSGLNSTLQQLTINDLCDITQLAQKIKTMKGGKNSTWNPNISEKVTTTLDYLIQIAKYLENKLKITLTKSNKLEQEIPLLEFEKLYPTKAKKLTDKTWTDYGWKILTNDSKYYNTKIEDYVYKFTTNDTPKKETFSDRLCITHILKNTN